MMKKLCTLLMAAVVIFSIVACSAGGNKPAHDHEVQLALKAISAEWENQFAKYDSAAPYLEVKNTRVIMIQENAPEEFADVSCVVEFVLFSNFVDTAPYYENVNLFDSVLIYQNGEAEVQRSNPLTTYQQKNFTSPYPTVIASVEDYNGAYNQVLKQG